MQNKRILFTAPSVTELVDIPMPEMKPGHVLVKVAYSTISSGTERANLVGSTSLTPNSKPGTPPTYPRGSGYSTSGVVEAVGEGVESLKVGDRVAMCWTTHSRWVCMPEKNVIKISDCLGFSETSLLHIAAFPLAAIRKCRLEIGESAIVMGQGILGQMALGLLRAAGAAPIIACDPVAAKRERALELGADYALDPLEPDFAEKVKELTNGGAHVAIEVTGVGAGLNGALDCMRKFGRVALLGCTRNSDFTVDYYRKVHGPGITLVGAHTIARPEEESYPGYWTTRDDMMAMERLLCCGRLDWSKLVEEVHSPAEAPEVYNRLATEKFFPIVQFDWSLLD